METNYWKKDVVGEINFWYRYSLVKRYPGTYIRVLSKTTVCRRRRGTRLLIVQGRLVSRIGVLSGWINTTNDYY